MKNFDLLFVSYQNGIAENKKLQFKKFKSFLKIKLINLYGIYKNEAAAKIKISFLEANLNSFRFIILLFL